jgi:phage anti-repressor protein
MSEAFNIVNFIESNPLSKLSTTYNHRLLEKIKTSFQESEQQMFISSFYCYLNYDSKTDFVIDLDNIWSWLGFNKKFNAKRLLEQFFVEDKDYKSLLLRSEEQTTTGSGGHNKQSIVLNIHTFKRLCMRAGTKKADEVHEYFIKLEEILHEVLKEESEELRNQLQESTNRVQALEAQNVNLQHTNELDKQSMLCQQYDKKHLVYIMKLETLDNGHFLIKIGETTDIKSRITSVSAAFGVSAILLDVFPCEHNYEFEQFLHHQPEIKKYKYRGLVNKQKKSTETYAIPAMNVYRSIKKLIQRHLPRYHSQDTERIKYIAINNMLELYKDDKPKFEELLKQITTPVSLNNQIIVPRYEENVTSNDASNNDILEYTFEPTDEIGEPISRPNSYSPKVQIYNPNDLTTVVKVFDSIMEATRQVKGSSYSHIKYASRNRTVYKGYRWYLVIHGDPAPKEPKDIGTTVESNTKKSGLVAMLNTEQNKVIKVFLLQKDAAAFLSTHTSLVCSAIRYGTELRGHFWVSWDDLNQTIKDEYLKTNVLPEITKKSKGTVVQQINPHTNLVEREFPSISDATKQLKISTKTIKRSSMEDIQIGDWKWKIL